MNRSLAAAAVVSLGLVTSGCATKFCSAECGTKTIEETANFTAKSLKNEIAQFVGRAKAAGMTKTAIRHGNIGTFQTNYNERSFNEFLEGRLSAGIGGKADACIKDHVIRNISWAVDDAMLDRGAFSVFHNTWKNAASCNHSKSFKQEEIQRQWDSSAGMLRQLNFTAP